LLGRQARERVRLAATLVHNNSIELFLHEPLLAWLRGATPGARFARRVFAGVLLLTTAWAVASWAVALAAAPGLSLLACGLAHLAALLALLWWAGRRMQQQEATGEAEAIRMRGDKATTADRTKQEFLANTSHELRTPMNAIVGMADLLWATDLTADQRRYVRTFRDASGHLLGIINDILDFSKMQAGVVELASAAFDVRNAAEQACELLGSRARKKGLLLVCDLAPDLPLLVQGDAQRIRQIIVHLLDNAVKFTDHGEVILRVQRDAKRPDCLEFSVSDTGVGIDPAQLAGLFASFTQRDASLTRRHGGTGLGLTLAATLVDRMGGAMGAERAPGQGSVFRFTVPMPEVPLAAAGGGRRTPSAVWTPPSARGS